jgi:L-arabinose isomerase
MDTYPQDNRPKAGLLLLSAEWFIQVGAHQGRFSDLPRNLDQDAAQIEASLASAMDVVNPGILTARQQVTEAVARFKQEDVDLVIVCHVTWAEDRLILEAVQQLPSVPLLLWCYAPFSRLPDPLSMSAMFRASGAVGTLQASGPLKRLGRSFGYAFGSYANPSAIQQIVAYAQAARVARRLRRAVIGVLPYRCDQMTGTYVDEFRLKHEIGPELKYISTHDYGDICNQIAGEEVAAFVTGLRRTYPASPELTAAGLERGARVSLGLAELAKRYHLDAIAIEDIGEEMHRVIGLRPCLSVPALFERAVVSMEAEVGGAVALMMQKMLSGQPPMYTEIFTFDESENCILAGHAGIHDIRLAESPADVLLEPDGEYVETEPDSAWMRFRARGGQVTLLSVFCDVDRFKLVIARGEALGGKPMLLGSPHIYVHLQTPLAEFFEKSLRTGMTQHWAVVHADTVPGLLALADILGLEKVVI